MNEQQNTPQDEADAADDDVSVAEESVFAAENRRGRENERLCSIELRHRVTVINFQNVATPRQFSIQRGPIVLDASVKLPKVRQRRRSHPHNQIFVLKSVVLLLFWVEIPQVARP